MIMNKFTLSILLSIGTVLLLGAGYTSIVRGADVQAPASITFYGHFDGGNGASFVFTVMDGNSPSKAIKNKNMTLNESTGPITQHFFVGTTEVMAPVTYNAVPSAVASSKGTDATGNMTDSNCGDHGAEAPLAKEHKTSFDCPMNISTHTYTTITYASKTISINFTQAPQTFTEHYVYNATTDTGSLSYTDNISP